MTPARKQRLTLAALMVIAVGFAVFIATMSFRENMMFFLSPAEVVEGKAPAGKVFRLGGLVVDGSVQHSPDSLAVAFTLTDHQSEVVVNFNGILPDLFREGQGIIARGAINEEGVFIAEEVLAKHDENYMSPEVAAALKERGVFKADQAERDQQ